MNRSVRRSDVNEQQDGRSNILRSLHVPAAVATAVGFLYIAHRVFAGTPAMTNGGIVSGYGASADGFLDNGTSNSTMEASGEVRKSHGEGQNDTAEPPEKVTDDTPPDAGHSATAVGHGLQRNTSNEVRSGSGEGLAEASPEKAAGGEPDAGHSVAEEPAVGHERQRNVSKEVRSGSGEGPAEAPPDKAAAGEPDAGHSVAEEPAVSHERQRNVSTEVSGGRGEGRGEAAEGPLEKEAGDAPEVGHKVTEEPTHGHGLQHNMSEEANASSAQGSEEGEGLFAKLSQLREKPPCYFLVAGMFTKPCVAMLMLGPPRPQTPDPSFVGRAKFWAKQGLQGALLLLALAQARADGLNVYKVLSSGLSVLDKGLLALIVLSASPNLQTGMNAYGLHELMRTILSWYHAHSHMKGAGVAELMGPVGYAYVMVMSKVYGSLCALLCMVAVPAMLAYAYVALPLFVIMVVLARVLVDGFPSVISLIRGPPSGDLVSDFSSGITADEQLELLREFLDDPTLEQNDYETQMEACLCP